LSNRRTGRRDPDCDEQRKDEDLRESEAVIARLSGTKGVSNLTIFGYTTEAGSGKAVEDPTSADAFFPLFLFVYLLGIVIVIILLAGLHLIEIEVSVYNVVQIFISRY